MKMPWCAVCQRPVEYFEQRFDWDHMGDVYVARCHGAEQIVALSHADSVRAKSIELGQAFTRAALGRRNDKPY
jgi:hypothetical protein